MPDASGSLRSFRLPVHLERVLDNLLKPEPVFEIAPVGGRKDGVRLECRLWKPSVYKYLDPLHGYRGARLADGSYEAVCPPLVERIRRYTQALGVVHAFSSWEDLLPISVYRRRVSDEDIEEIDYPFYLLVCKAEQVYPPPVKVAWLAERMPPGSSIQRMLKVLAG